MEFITINQNPISSFHRFLSWKCNFLKNKNVLKDCNFKNDKVELLIELNGKIYNLEYNLTNKSWNLEFDNDKIKTIILNTENNDFTKMLTKIITEINKLNIIIIDSDEDSDEEDSNNTDLEIEQFLNVYEDDFEHSNEFEFFYDSD